jgi:hypothetical protein
MDLREKTFRTFHHRFGESGIKGTLPFTVAPEKPHDLRSMDEEKPLNMMLVFSADTIYIYEVANAASAVMAEVGLDLRCKYQMHSIIQSVNYFTSSEENKTIFLACLDDMKVATLCFNYQLSAIETVALHRLSTRDSLALLSASSYKPTKPLLRVDVSSLS